ncbi:MAG: hypothetical protein IJ443_04995 [Firmicutes bacterium]|nr:hypothetical protein [Bacillota bacterium]
MYFFRPTAVLLHKKLSFSENPTKSRELLDFWKKDDKNAKFSEKTRKNMEKQSEIQILLDEYKKRFQKSNSGRDVFQLYC